MNLFEAFVLGLVEGISEYLPISSTGHLILASSLMGLTERVDKASLDAFNIVIQGGAILAVLGLYRARVAQMVQGVLGRNPTGLRLAINLLVAFLPAAILGVLLADLIKRHLFFPVPVISALAAGGVLMIAVSRWQHRAFHDRPQGGGDTHVYVGIDALTPGRALVIGLLQCVAMWPGTSRSMVTIVGGMLVGMRPRQAAEFSFLLGLPTLTGACVYDGAKNLLGDGDTMIQTLGAGPLVVGMAVATISAVVAIRWLVSFLTRHGLGLFGWYRIALSVVMAALIWQGLVEITPDEAIPATPLVSPDRP